MNKLDARTRTLILRCLVEGNSIRATARLADVSKVTVNSFSSTPAGRRGARQGDGLHVARRAPEPHHAQCTCAASPV